MKKTLSAFCLSLLSVPGWAQQAPPPCPTLPGNTELRWEQRADVGFITCRAVSPDGRPVLNVMLTSRDPKIRLQRALRAEESTFSGEKMYWYRLDLGGREVPGMESRRISVVELDDDLYAQVWINADSQQELATLIGLAQQLDASATSAPLSAGR
ncbi:MAG TPA: hypothetical protein DEP36_02940 [Gammaproteobacteria bacterium]|nr:hypothetical protein [Gammaproteobacteria bacterium]